MPKVSLASIAGARPSAPPVGVDAEGETLALFDRDRDPIHLFAHRLAAGERLTLAEGAIDRLLHVWQGVVVAGNVALPAGSTLIVEHGARQGVVAEADSLLLSFNGTTMPQGAGGHVHALPRERVPRFDGPGGAATGGGLHADGECPGCGVWLHENSFPAMAEGPTPQDAERGIHSHGEDEIIFVTDGAIRLGQRLYGAGTALAVAADTLYGFTPGPEGARFINFRAAQPSEIRFANGQVMDEVGYWRERVSRPVYLEPAA